MPRSQAMSEAVNRFPSLLRKHQAERPGSVEKEQPHEHIDLPHERWESAVTSIMKRDRCPRHIAFERAAREHPGLHLAYLQENR